MSWLRRILQKLGAVPHYTDDDLINAETENDLYDHGKALEAARSAFADRKLSETKLRGVLDAHDARTAAFAQFEQRLKKETNHVRNHL